MVKMFKPEFAPLVAAGTKTQTVRPTPKRMPRAGDPLSLRRWSGAPYRSKQQVLRTATVLSVSPCAVTATGVSVDHLAVPEDDFARADGFRDFRHMADWFLATHGLPFAGILIRWQCLPVVPLAHELPL